MVCKFAHIPGCNLNFRIMGKTAGGTAKFSQRKTKTLLFKDRGAWGKIWDFVALYCFLISSQLCTTQAIVSRSLTSLRCQKTHPEVGRTTKNLG